MLNRLPPAWQPNVSLQNGKNSPQEPKLFRCLCSKPSLSSHTCNINSWVRIQNEESWSAPVFGDQDTGRSRGHVDNQASDCRKCIGVVLEIWKERIIIFLISRSQRNWPWLTCEDIHDCVSNLSIHWWVSDWVPTFEFWQKEWLLRLQTLLTFGWSDKLRRKN